MKTRLVVLLAAALALMIFVLTGANAVGVGNMCGGIGGIQCDAGLFCQKKPEHAASSTCPAPAQRFRGFVQSIFGRSAAAMARRTTMIASACWRWFPRIMTASATRRCHVVVPRTV